MDGLTVVLLVAFFCSDVRVSPGVRKSEERFYYKLSFPIARFPGRTSTIWAVQNKTVNGTDGCSQKVCSSGKCIHGEGMISYHGVCVMVTLQAT